MGRARYQPCLAAFLGQKVRHGQTSRIKAVREKAQAVNDSERIRQLEKENANLREERDILRKAAKYFAEETHW